MQTHTESSQLNLPVSKVRDHIRGRIEAPVTLVEYGDFECPHCGAAYPVLEEALDAFRDDVRLVYRHFPLTTVHPHAEKAAEAAEAAGAQNRFWEMHDTLYENQMALSDNDLARHAQNIVDDLQQFIRELLDGTHADRVRQDFLSGVLSGVNGTPSLFVNGLRYNGPMLLEGLGTAIQSELERGGQKPRSGSARRRYSAS